MEIIIRGTEKEIANLINEIQGRRNLNTDELEQIKQYVFSCALNTRNKSRVR